MSFWHLSMRRCSASWMGLSYSFDGDLVLALGLLEVLLALVYRFRLGLLLLGRIVREFLCLIKILLQAIDGSRPVCSTLRSNCRDTSTSATFF